MQIIVNKHNYVVAAIGTLKKYWPNGYPIVADMLGNECAYPVDFADMYDVDFVPDNIEVDKYCYTPETGFYENPDYVEPDPYGIPDELVERIKNDAITEVEEAVINADK